MMIFDTLARFLKVAPNRKSRAETSPTPPSTARLTVEHLEDRTLLANDTPFIVASGVLPPDGSIVQNPHPVIQIQYSEPMVGTNGSPAGTGAANPNNYVLFDALGNTISIENATLDPTSTFVQLDYNGGLDLINSTYTLFVRGSQLFDQDDGRPLAQVGQIVVANTGQNNVSIVQMPGDGTLGAVSDYPIPPVAAVAATPVAVAFAELSGDAIPDLITVNTGNHTVAIYQGRIGGGYSLSPTLELNLRSDLAAGLDKDIAIDDFNKDGLLDIAVSNQNTNEVSIFLNTRTTVGQIQFGGRVDFAAGTGPLDVVAGDFDGDSNVDLAVLNTANVSILLGDGAGLFAAPFAVPLGGLSGPTALAVGQLGGDSKPDLAVSGFNGLTAMVANSVVGTPNFITTRVQTLPTTSVDVGDVDNDGNVDLVATTNSGGGQVLVFRNVGGVFLAPSRVVVGPNPRDVQLRDLNGDTLLDVTYVNQQAPGKFGVLLNTGETVNGLITDASNPGVGPIEIFSANHGLSTGTRVRITGVLGNTAANGDFTITVTGASTFELNGSTGNGTYGGGGTWTLSSRIFGATNSSDIVIQSPSHSLQNGDQVTVFGVQGNSAANGTYVITVVDADRFSLNGSAGNGRFTFGSTWASGGNVTNATNANPIVITSASHGLTTGDQVLISGVQGNTNANGVFQITTIDANNFSLNGAVGNGAYVTNAGFTRSGAITTATNTAPIVITSNNHQLTTGTTVVIAGVATNTAANGTFVITVIDANQFSLNGSNGTAVGAGTGGTWTTAARQITDATNTSPIEITSAGHGLTTGQTVAIAGVTGNTAANGTFVITVIDANRFSLNNSIGNGNFTNGGVWRHGNFVTNATNQTPIQITSAANHGLATGAPVIVTGVGGNTAANGNFLITVTGLGRFTLNGSAGNGFYTTGGQFVSGGELIDASDRTPIEIFSLNHGLQDGDRVTISGAVGNTAANGQFTVTVIDANRFTLNGSSGNGLYENGGIWQKTSFLPSPGSPFAVDDNPVAFAFGDTNQDNVLDVVTVNSTASTFSLLTGTAAGDFKAALNVNLTPSPVRAIATGDLNNDGLTDIVAVNNSSSTSQSLVSVILATPTGFAAPVEFSAQFPGRTFRDFVSVAIGDINNDNRPDIVIGAKQDDEVGFLINNTPAGGQLDFTAIQEIITGDRPSEVALADFDEDGNLDLAVAHDRQGGFGGGFGSSRRGVTVHLGNGDGTFGFGVNHARGIEASSLAIADFDRDGHLDFVVADRSTPSKVQLRLGDGDGDFSFAGDFDVGPEAENLTVADFNRDGFLDVAVSSTSTVTSNNISILLNSFATGFNPFIPVSIPNGTAIQSIIAYDVNEDPFPDLIVSLVPGAGGFAEGNLFALIGNGDGTFGEVTPYLAGDEGATAATPSYVAVLNPVPLVRVTTFSTLGGPVLAELINNGDFEDRDLAGEQGNLSGWTIFKLNNSHGAWSPQTDDESPLSLVRVLPPTGDFRAMLDQQDLRPIEFVYNPPGGGGFFDGDNFNTAESYAGTHLLYQDLTIPASAEDVQFTFSLFIDNTHAGVYSDTQANPSLDYRTVEDNQQVRVDIVDPTANIINTGTGVLQNLFITAPDENNLRSLTQTVDLTAFAGQTIRVRFGAANNLGKLLVGVDNVSLRALYVDSTPPTLSNVQLRNPGFNGNTTDTTIIGRVSDNGEVSNVAFVEIDVQNDGFGLGDARINNFDADGNFSYTITNLPAGPATVGITAVDTAGNVTTTTVSFTVVTLSPVEWLAVGPDSINVEAVGFNFEDVAGRITEIAFDPRDPSGNTYYIGSANGGVWKTTNGGGDWTPLTDFVVDSQGVPVATPIGGLAISRSNPDILYAGTGVGDQAFDSRPGFGVLKSIDGGATWTVAGDSGVVLKGAQIVKMIVDANNPNFAYAAVAAGGISGPGIYRTLDGGLTWVNVLLPQNMLDPNGNPLGAGVPLASVTDVVIDPFNSNDLLIGLGNIGLVPGSSTAGLWKTANRGASWRQIVGGDNPIVQSNTLPSGTGVGRVTIAQGSGRIGDEATFYVMLGTPPPGAFTPGAFDEGSFQGVYKTSNGGLDWTKIMLKENIGGNSSAFPENFVDLDLTGTEASNVGAIAVDRANRNVIFIGGARRFGTTLTTHSLIRVDTGNMRDATYNDPDFGFINDGDDRTKAFVAHNPGTGPNDNVNLPNPSPPPPTIPGIRLPDTYGHPQDQGGQNRPPRSTAPYTGEGVYWYDIEYGEVNNSGFGRNLPPAMQALVIDPQGRLLVGTSAGIWRGLNLGYGYDYTSGGEGILRQFNVIDPPAITLTSLNSNLQITNLTGVAIDPQAPGRYYVSMFETGTALTSGGLVWQTMGLTGPVDPLRGNLGIPHAGSVSVSSPDPTLPDAPSTVFRSWANLDPDALRPETSQTGGGFGSFQSDQAAGISVNELGGFLPPLEVNPVKIFESGAFQDELLFAGQRVYLTRTSSNLFNDIVGRRLSDANDFISAMSFAPPVEENIPGVYAGTDNGEVFVDLRSGADNWPQRDAGLPGKRINGIAVDPVDPNIAYLAVGGIGNAHVFKTINAGVTWVNISSNLPDLPANDILIDRRPGLGTNTGKLYVATDVGVYVSLNEGQQWILLGKALPSVPVVKLSIDTNLEVLAAATQGRGAYVISTAAFSPIPDQVIAEDTSTGPLQFTLNDVGITNFTVSVSGTSDNQTLVPNSNIVFGGSGTIRTVTVTPAPDQFGIAQITVSVTDGVRVFSDTFQLTVNNVNDAPTVTPPADQTIDLNQAVGPLNFTIGDVDDLSTDLIVAATSDNQTLIPDGNITLGGTGSTRTISFTPATDQNGIAIISLAVTDPGGASTTATFAVQVNTTASLPFSDDFNRPNNQFVGPVWTEQIGDFRTQNNQVTSSVAGSSLVTVNGIAAANVAVSATITVSPTAVHSVGLVARYTGSLDRNFYMAWITSSGGSATASIFRNVNGTFTLLSSRSLGAGFTTGTFRFETVGDSLNLFLNDNFFLSAFDGTLTQDGSVGIRAFNTSTTGGMVDDFSATEITLQSETLPFSDSFDVDEDQLSRSWLDRAGHFGVQGTQAQSLVTGSSLAIVNGISGTDVVVTADVSVNPAAGHSVGLVARYNGPFDRNFYMAWISGSGGNVTASIFRNVNGTFTSLGSKTLAGSAGQVRFEVVGTSLKLFFNGGFVLEAHDASITQAGSVGIRAFSGNSIRGAIDNFSADVLDVLQDGALPFSDTYDQASDQLSNFWLGRAGHFAVVGNQAQASVAGSSLAAVNGISATNVVVSADVNVNPAAGHSVGLVARYSGPLDRNFYLAWISGSGGNVTATIFRNVNGTFTSLGSRTLSGASGEVRFEVIGTSQKLFFNDQFVLETHDGVITQAGTVGIRAFSSTLVAGTIDNFNADVRPDLLDATLPFTDTYDQVSDQLSDFWFGQAGHFAVQGNQVQGSTGNSLAVLNGVSEANVSVSADVSVTPTAGHSVGLVARYSGPFDRNFYMAWISGSGGTVTASIFRNVNGTFTLLKSATLVGGAGEARFEVVGSSLKLFFNDQFVVSAIDTTITAAGSVGIRAFNSTTTAGTLDNFNAATITIQNESLPFSDDYNQSSSELSRSWSETAGRFAKGTNQAVASVSGTSLATVNGISAADVAISATMSVNPSGGHSVGLVARQTGNSFYLAWISGVGGNVTASIYRNVNGTFTLLSSTALASGTGDVRFEVLGNSLQLFFNNVLATQAIDAVLSGPGSIGIRAFNSGGIIDDFAAVALP